MTGLGDQLGFGYVDSSCAVEHQSYLAASAAAGPTASCHLLPEACGSQANEPKLLLGRIAFGVWFCRLCLCLRVVGSGFRTLSYDKPFCDPNEPPKQKPRSSHVVVTCCLEQLGISEAAGRHLNRREGYSRDEASKIQACVFQTAAARLARSFSAKGRHGMK